MDDVLVYKTGVERLTELMKDTFTAHGFKTFYEGDPGLIPKDYYPCIIVEKEEAQIDVASTAHDEMVETISIRVVLNKQDDIDASDAGDEVDLTERKLRKLIEGRDKTTGQYMDGTLLYAIRTRLTLDQFDINSTVKIRYGQIDRRDTQSSEGMVTMSLTERILVPNRQ